MNSKYSLVEKSVLKYVVMACMAAYCGLPSAAHATISFAPSLSSEALVYFADQNTGGNYGTTTPPCTQLGSGTTVTCNSSATTPDGATLTYDSTATTSYGVLHAAGSSSLSNTNVPGNTAYYSATKGTSSFQDAWTINGGTGTGTLKLQFALDGTYSYCNGGVELSFGLYNFTSSTSSDGTPSLGLCSGSLGTQMNPLIATLTTGFTFGQPVDFSVTMIAGSDLTDGGSAISSYMDFSNTATMNSIIVDNSQGTQIPFTLSTGSGASLFSTLAPSPTVNSVPEPATLSIFGFGLAGLGFMLRRRMRT